MDKPGYVLKFNEAVLMPTGEKNNFTFIKVGVWVIVCVLILGSFIFHDNLFSELSWTARVLLILLAVGVAFLHPKKKYTPSPIEIQFYDNYLVIYLPKRYYNRRVTRMEINRMNYTEITKCVIKTQSRRVHIYGGGTSTWFNYKPDGSLPQSPTQVRNYAAGMIYFNVQFSTNIDFKTEIESHSPIEVIVENS